MTHCIFHTLHFLHLAYPTSCIFPRHAGRGPGIHALLAPAEHIPTEAGSNAWMPPSTIGSSRVAIALSRHDARATLVGQSSRRSGKDGREAGNADLSRCPRG